jgi:hypothetical protein
MHTELFFLRPVLGASIRNNVFQIAELVLAVADFDELFRNWRDWMNGMQFAGPTDTSANARTVSFFPCVCSTGDIFEWLRLVATPHEKFNSAQGVHLGRQFFNNRRNLVDGHIFRTNLPTEEI